MSAYMYIYAWIESCMCACVHDMVCVSFDGSDASAWIKTCVTTDCELACTNMKAAPGSEQASLTGGRCTAAPGVDLSEQA